MKKILLLILALIVVISLASCEFFDIDNDMTHQDPTTESTNPSVTRPPITNPTTTTTKEPSSDPEYIYNAFTSSEKQKMNNLLGEVIPFLSNDEYYFEEYEYEYEDGITEIGVNFYACGNTKAEFESYRSKFSSYTYVGTEKDDYGDAWYFYSAPDGSYYVDLSYYFTDDYGYIVDVYAYIYEDSNSSGGSSGGNDDQNYTYTAFTSAERHFEFERTLQPFAP